MKIQRSLKTIAQPPSWNDLYSHSRTLYFCNEKERQKVVIWHYMVGWFLMPQTLDSICFVVRWALPMVPQGIPFPRRTMLQNRTDWGWGREFRFPTGTWTRCRFRGRGRRQQSNQMRKRMKKMRTREPGRRRRVDRPGCLRLRLQRGGMRTSLPVLQKQHSFQVNIDSMLFSSKVS